MGESGCGKSTLGRIIMQLQPLSSGRIRWEGEDLARWTARDLRRRRIDFQMIFQDPYSSLDPRQMVFATLAEAVRVRHPRLGGAMLRDRVVELMRLVGLDPVLMRRYPHQFSGGQRQRIVIARALAPEPKLIVADEAVSALDVSIQSQIINLLKDLCHRMGLTMIFISHDLSVVRYIANRIAVMYLGQIVELGAAEDVVDHPLHLYTRALMSAIPLPNPELERARHRIALRAEPPSMLDPPGGCRFWPRSPIEHDERMKRTVPALIEAKPGHWVADCPFCVDHAA